MPKHRFKKYERSQTPPKFRIGSADFKILELLSDYRFLDTRQILDLCPGQAERTIKRKLLNLFQAGYIERPIQQFSCFKPSGYLVYSLGKKGAALVSQNNGSAVKAKSSREIGVSFLGHSLMISGFRTALSVALDKNSQSKLRAWKDLGLIDAVHCEGERLPIAPDAFFTIEDKDYFTHFFLEADRSTMTLERMLNKFKGYWNWRLEGGQKRKLGISTFRVLTVCISEQRAENLRQMAAKANGKETGSDMFWFACEKSYSLENSKNILTPIWKSAKGDSLRHLLE